VTVCKRRGSLRRGRRPKAEGRPIAEGGPGLVRKHGFAHEDNGSRRGIRNAFTIA